MFMHSLTLSEQLPLPPVAKNRGYAQFWASIRNDLGNDTLNE